MAANRRSGRFEPNATPDALINSGGHVYRAQIVGYFQHGEAAARAEAIFDASRLVPRLLLWRDMSHLGRVMLWKLLGSITANKLCRVCLPLNGTTPKRVWQLPQRAARRWSYSIRARYSTVGLPLPFRNDIGKFIASALNQAGISPQDALVAVGRASIELRFLNVPPVPNAELPDLVRFQASRQFLKPHEGGELDFVPLNSSGIHPLRFWQLQFQPMPLNHVRTLCSAAGLTPIHLAYGRLLYHPSCSPRFPRMHAHL